MCLLRDDWLHVSYRIGRKNGYPPGRQTVPVVLYYTTLVGSGGAFLKIHANCLESGVHFKKPSGQEESDWTDEVYCPPAYYISPPRLASRLGVNEEGIQMEASYCFREILQGDYNGEIATLVLSVSVQGHFREDEESRVQLEELMAYQTNRREMIFFRSCIDEEKNA
jgi:hypothetical protein